MVRPTRQPSSPPCPLMHTAVLVWLGPLQHREHFWECSDSAPTPIGSLRLSAWYPPEQLVEPVQWAATLVALARAPGNGPAVQLWGLGPCAQIRAIVEHSETATWGAVQSLAAWPGTGLHSLRRPLITPVGCRCAPGSSVRTPLTGAPGRASLRDQARFACARKERRTVACQACTAHSALGEGDCVERHDDHRSITCYADQLVSL